jgi:hypothetical protein
VTFIASITDRYALSLYRKNILSIANCLMPCAQLRYEPRHPFPTVVRTACRCLPLLDRVGGPFYADMDRAYAEVADRYGFHCNGCADSCCLTRFYHHTLLEYLYLAEWVRGLASDRRPTGHS